MGIVKKLGFGLFKYSWNSIIGIVWFLLVIVMAVFTVFGELGAKVSAVVGTAWFGFDIIFALFRIFDTWTDWLQLFGGAFILMIGPAFAVGVVSELLKHLVDAMRDHCFID